MNKDKTVFLKGEGLFFAFACYVTELKQSHEKVIHIFVHPMKPYVIWILLLRCP